MSLSADLHPLVGAFPYRLKLKECRQILHDSFSLFINRNNVITVIQQHQLFFY